MPATRKRSRAASAATGGFSIVREQAEHVSRLSGPISVCLLHNERLGKTVCVFGEWHDTKIICPARRGKITQSVEDYIVNTIESTQQTVDVFLESPYISSRYTDTRFDELERNPSANGSVLKSLYTRAKACLVSDKSGCPWRNSRWHAIDIRDHEAVRQYFSTISDNPWGSTWAVRILGNSMVDTMRGFSAVIASALDGLEGFARLSTAAAWDEVDRALKIDRQAARIRDAKCLQVVAAVKEERLRMSVQPKQVNELRAKWKKVLAAMARKCPRRGLPSPYPPLHPAWLDVGGKPLHDVLEDTNKLLWRCFHLTALVMDLYTLTRMLRMDDARNCVFYGGKAHAENLVGMLEAAGFVIRYQSSVEEQAVEGSERSYPCLNVDEMPQPFFS